jgi:signal transduction histidine kinase
MRLSSIQSRILSGVGALQLLVAIASSFFVVQHTRQESLAALDSNLASRATSLLALIQLPEEQDRAPILRRQLLALPQQDRFRVTDSRGSVVAETPDSAWPERLASGDSGSFPLQMQRASYRALVLRNVLITDSEEGEHSVPQAVALIYATPAMEMEAHVRKVTASTVLAGFAMLSLSLLLTFLIVRMGLRPLNTLAAEAALVDPGESAWQPPAGSLEVSELRPLAAALSNTINRLIAAFERERQVFGDAAHELKTAVAIVKSTLQLGLQLKRPAEDYRERLTRALDDTDRLSALVIRILQLAAIENPHTYRITRTDVSAAIASVLDQMSTVAQARGVDLQIPCFEAHSIAVPEQEYALLVTNLLENAIQHSDSGKPVKISITSQNGASRLILEDHGAGIPAEALPHIFERFFRTDQSRSRATGGFGLGLAIVHAITVRYHGTISAHSVPGHGTTFTVCLPLFQSPPLVGAKAD